MARHEEQKAKQDKFFNNKKENLGFVVFVSGLNKEASRKQQDVYKALQMRYDIAVEYIDMDINQELVKTLNLTTTPENFLLYKNSKGETIWQRIKAGFITENEIINNTMFLFENAILEKDK